MTVRFSESAKVMSKGQVTIPKDIRKVLGVDTGDHVVFVVENQSVRIINSAVYALEFFQAQMKNASAEAGLNSEEDIVNYLKELRAQKEAE